MGRDKLSGVAESAEVHDGMKKGAPSCVKVPYQGETGNGTKNAPKSMTGNRMVVSLREF